MSAPVKLTLRMDAEVIEQAKRYAAAHGTSLSQMVAGYFAALTQESDPAEEGEFTKRLRLREPISDTSMEDFWQALQKKHGPVRYG